MKNFLMIRFLDLFRWLFTALNYDYDTIRMVLQLKFTVNSRRPIMNLGAKKKSKDIKNSTLPAVGFHLFMGIMIITMVAGLSSKSIFLGLGIFFLIQMVFIFMSLFAEFSVSFLDTIDSTLLLPTPIDRKSLNAAKNLHIVLFYLQLVLALSLPNTIYLGIAYGVLPAIVFLLSNVMVMLFLIVLISIIYGLLIQKFSGEKLKDMVNRVQVVLSLIVIGSYYSTIYKMEFFVEHAERLMSSRFLYFIPPLWFSSLTTSLIEKKFNTQYMILTSIAIFVSIVGYYFYIKYIAPEYENNLLKFTSHSKGAGKKRKNGFLSSIFSQTDFAPYFNLADRMISSDRKLKLSIFPTIGMAIFFSVVFPIIKSDSIAELAQNRGQTLMMYLVSLFSMQILMFVNYSEYAKASWLFNFIPTKSPVNLIKGSIIALFVKFLLPMYLFTGLSYLVLFKGKIIMDVIAFLLNSTLICLAYLLISKRELPFSKEYQGRSAVNNRSWTLLFASFVLAPIIGGTHFLMIWLEFNMLFYIPVQVIILIAAFKGYFKMTWDDVRIGL